MNNFSAHISSSEMINFILSAAKEKYSRNLNEDQKLIRLYAARRNTIHNLGVRENESLKPITINGRKINLEKGRGTSTEDLRSLVDHCEELVFIYIATVESLAISEWNLYFESRN